MLYFDSLNIFDCIIIAAIVCFIAFAEFIFIREAVKSGINLSDLCPWKMQYETLRMRKDNVKLMPPLGNLYKEAAENPELRYVPEEVRKARIEQDTESKARAYIRNVNNQLLKKYVIIIGVVSAVLLVGYALSGGGLVY